MKVFKIAIAALLAAGFFALIPLYVVKRQALLTTIGCDAQHPRSLHIVVIDASDPYDRVDANRVTQQVRERLAAQSQATHFVLLRPNDDDAYEPIEATAGCVGPELPDSSAYLMSHADQSAYRKGREEALAMVEKAAQALLKAGPLRTSPLLETTIAISKRHDLRTAANVTLIYYSDMEQNSASLSVYGQDGVQQTLSAENLEEVSLRNARVEVNRIVRRSHLGLGQAKRLQDMWTTWFTRSEATTEWSK